MFCLICLRKEGNVLFNEVLNTFYLRLYGNTSAFTWATLYDLQQGFFYMHHPTDKIAHNTDKIAHNTDKIAHNTDKIAHNTDKIAHNTDFVLYHYMNVPTLCCP